MTKQFEVTFNTDLFNIKNLIITAFSLVADTFVPWTMLKNVKLVRQTTQWMQTFAYLPSLISLRGVYAMQCAGMMHSKEGGTQVLVG
jgi:hypothetical protein